MTTEDLIAELRRYPGVHVGIEAMEANGIDAETCLIGILRLDPAPGGNGGIRVKLVPEETMILALGPKNY